MMMKGDDMNWDRTHESICGLYLNSIPFSGTVESSRVKYGGDVEHTVWLNNPIWVFGAKRVKILITERRGEFI